MVLDNSVPCEVATEAEEPRPVFWCHNLNRPFNCKNASLASDVTFDSANVVPDKQLLIFHPDASSVGSVEELACTLRGRERQCRCSHRMCCVRLIYAQNHNRAVVYLIEETRLEQHRLGYLRATAVQRVSSVQPG